MTVEQLIEKLSEYPNDMQVLIDERKTEFAYGLLNGVSSKEIIFHEDPDDPSDEPMATDTVVILSEE